MDKLEAVPVDTHVLSIARNTYDFMKEAGMKGTAKNNNLTDKSYKAIGEIRWILTRDVAIYLF